MKVFLKIVKWCAKSIALLLGLVLLAGLVCRIFSPNPIPPGKLVDVDGYKLHINSIGEKNNKPTLVIEAGAGAPGEYLSLIHI